MKKFVKKFVKNSQAVTFFCGTFYSLTNDKKIIHLDSSLKSKYTLKNSALNLLSSLRKLIVNTLFKHVEICMKFQATTKCDISLDSLLKYKCTLKLAAMYLLYS